MISISSYSQNLGNPAQIGQTGKNQKVGKGFQIEDTLLAKGKVRFSVISTASTKDTFVTVVDTAGYVSKVGKSTFLSGVNTDAQTLSLTRDTLSISNGNSLKLPSTIFPNGVKIIEDTAYLLSSADAGYYLVAINPNTHFIMPTPCPFSVGDVIGFSGDLDTTTFDLSSTVTDIQMFTGQLSENGETFIMQCVDVGGGAEMLPLSAIINDNGTFKTLNKYLYDNQAFTTVPSSSSDTGTKGQMAIDSTYLYVCVDTNTWVRTLLVTW